MLAFKKTVDFLCELILHLLLLALIYVTIWANLVKQETEMKYFHPKIRQVCFQVLDLKNLFWVATSAIFNIDLDSNSQILTCRAGDHDEIFMEHSSKITTMADFVK